MRLVVVCSYFCFSFFLNYAAAKLWNINYVARNFTCLMSVTCLGLIQLIKSGGKLKEI